MKNCTVKYSFMNAAAERAIRPRALRKEARRSAIIRHAREAFLRDGYAGMSMSGLIAKLGGSKATLWSYFPSKEALFSAVLDDAAGGYARDVDEFLRLSDEPRSGLFEFCKSLIGTIISPEPLQLTRLVLAESGRSPEVGRSFYAHGVQPVEDYLTAYLTRHMEAGRLRAADPRLAAKTLIDLCNGPQIRCLWGAETLDEDAVALIAVNITDLFLRAYGP